MSLSRRHVLQASLATLLYGTAAARAGIGESSIFSLPSDGPFSTVLADPRRYRLKVLVCQLQGDSAHPSLHHAPLRSAPREWATPASLVKLPLAMLALEQLQRWQRDDPTLSLDSPISLRRRARCVASELAGAQSLRDVLEAIFVVSDNAAYNWLYDLLGPARIHRRLHELGFANARIVSHFAGCSESENAHGAVASVYGAEGRLTTADASERFVIPEHPLGNGARFGKGFYENGVLAPGAHDFSRKNFFPLEDIHRCMLQLVAPLAHPVAERFQISQRLRLALLDIMALTPADRRQRYPDPDAYPRHYNKFLVVGGGAPWPAGLHIQNKIGEAYGFLADTALLTDRANDLRLVVSAQIYCNADDLLNNGDYEYEALGRPFLAWLGRTLLDQARRRRTH